MLKKLIKHDFRALSRILFPMEIGVLAGTLLATLLVTVAVRIDIARAAEETANVGGSIFMGLSVTVAFLVGLAVCASIIVTLVVILSHFYKNFLLDEGYLTFTLPVTTSQLLLSKLITGIVWFLISMAVIGVSGIIFATFGTATEGVMNAGAVTFIGSLFGVFGSIGEYANAPIVVAEYLLLAFLMLVASILEMYFAIIVGGQVAKKNKLLAGIGMYLVINFAVGIFKAVFSALGYGLGGLGFVLSGSAELSPLLHGTAWLGIALYAVLSVIFFFWSRGILNKNLNLQ